MLVRKRCEVKSNANGGVNALAVAAWPRSKFAENFRRVGRRQKEGGMGIASTMLMLSGSRMRKNGG